MSGNLFTITRSWILKTDSTILKIRNKIALLHHYCMYKDAYNNYKTW